MLPNNQALNPFNGLENNHKSQSTSIIHDPATNVLSIQMTIFLETTLSGKKEPVNEVNEDNM